LGRDYAPGRFDMLGAKCATSDYLLGTDVLGASVR